MKQYTSQPVDAPFSITVYPGADGSFELFEDDERSFDYRRGGWMGIAMEWRDRDRRLTLALVPGSRMRSPLVRAIEVRLAGEQKVHRASFSGRRVTLILGSGL